MRTYLILAAIVSSTAASAHDAPSGMTYSAWCCNGNEHTGDCSPIPETTVRIVAGGYEITLAPGDHRKVTKVHVFQKAQTEARPSSDGQYHACLYPTENTLRCFFAPPLGM